ncbi:MAG: helix-turn-helix domain-containing protein [Candidatus Pacearchaeota archaeon]
MDEKKYILISMEDERSKKLADILGNKTCKKIIDLLAEEKEASEKDIADKLNVPLNTIEYNLKKLIQAELIEKTKNFFWSKKGKKIPTYKLSNKSIIISPKSRISSKLKSILPVALLSGLGAVLIKSFFYSQQIVREKAVAGLASEFSTQALQNTIFDGNILLLQSPAWVWFLAGTLFTLVIFTIINWRKL